MDENSRQNDKASESVAFSTKEGLNVEFDSTGSWFIENVNDYTEKTQNETNRSALGENDHLKPCSASQDLYRAVNSVGELFLESSNVDMASLDGVSPAKTAEMASLSEKSKKTGPTTPTTLNELVVQTTPPSGGISARP